MIIYNSEEDVKDILFMKIDVNNKYNIAIL